MITVSNPRHVCKGVKTLRVDGKIISGNKVPDLKDKKEHKVEAELG
jgi:cellobiose phosphorylase